MLAICGKKFGFDKFLNMIDSTVDLLKSEQQDDDQKEYCEMQLATADHHRYWEGKL